MSCIKDCTPGKIPPPLCATPNSPSSIPPATTANPSTGHPSSSTLVRKLQKTRQSLRICLFLLNSRDIVPHEYPASASTRPRCQFILASFTLKLLIFCDFHFSCALRKLFFAKPNVFNAALSLFLPFF